MSCLVLVGGVVGCGKTSLINFFKSNKDEIFPTSRNKLSSQISAAENDAVKSTALITVLFDDLCSIKEQAEMMKSFHGWRNFRADLLIAAEHFINIFKGSETITHGPLSQRSSLLYEKMKTLNCFDPSSDNVIFLIEDNFYYRSMRYDWFQIAKRTNVGFCQVFLHCALNTAISRNASRGDQIPEEKIKKMFNFIEYPDCEKYKWEKYSIKFDTTAEMNSTAIKPIVDVVREASEDPAEVMITKDKVEAQQICSKNVVHQVDKIIRKAISKKITRLKGSSANDCDLQSLVSRAVTTRQDFLGQLRRGVIRLPDDLSHKVTCLGIDSVEHECSEFVNEIFDGMFDSECRNLSCT